MNAPLRVMFKHTTVKNHWAILRKQRKVCTNVCHLFIQQICILRACHGPGAVTARDGNKNERHKDVGPGRSEAAGSSKAGTAGGWVSPAIGGKEPGEARASSQVTELP